MGEPVWGMQVKQGTTLYLCLEDSQLRIQNRLFNVTEDAPPNVHFCTESHMLGDGLVEQLEQFLGEHPDTSLIIIDTLQMIRGTAYDNTYANDYRDLSVLKHLADTHGIAISADFPGPEPSTLRPCLRREHPLCGAVRPRVRGFWRYRYMSGGRENTPLGRKTHPWVGQA